MTRLLRFQALKKMVGRDLPWEWPGRHSNNLEDLDTLESVFQPNRTSAWYTLREVGSLIITEDAWTVVF